MPRTGLALLALVIALLTLASLAAPSRAQGPAPSRPQAAAQSNVTQAAPAPATRFNVSPGILARTPGVASPAPAQAAPSDTLPATSRGNPATVPDFMGRTRSEANALAQSYHLVPAFSGATDNDALVIDQSPTAGAPLSRADGSVRLSMKAQEKAQASPWGAILGKFLEQLQRMPDFSRLSRSDASARAQSYHLVPVFEGATSDDARVTDQSPTAGVPLSQADGRVRLQMTAQAPPPQMPPPQQIPVQTQQPAPPQEPAQQPPKQLPKQQTQQPAPPQEPAQPLPPPPPAPPADAPPPQAAPLPPAPPADAPPPQAAPPLPPPLPPAPPPVPSCVSRDLISWLTPEQAEIPTCQALRTQNWLTLLAIIAALGWGTWALLHRPPDPPIPDHTFNSPQPSITAQLVTRTISTGLAAITASVHAADARRFDIRYVMERDARPRADAIRITMSGDGGDDGG